MQNEETDVEYLEIFGGGRILRARSRTRKTCPKIGLDFLLNIFGLNRFTTCLYNVNMRLRSPKKIFAASFKPTIAHVLADCIRNARLNPEIEALPDRSEQLSSKVVSFQPREQRSHIFLKYRLCGFSRSYSSIHINLISAINPLHFILLQSFQSLESTCFKQF